MQFPPTGEGLTQHAPVGGGGLQVVLVHVEPAPCQTPWAVAQSASVVMRQVTVPASVTQHAPVLVEPEQVKAPQTVPGPRQTPPPAVHSAWVLMVQRMAPADGVQHAPVGVELEQIPAVLQLVLSPR
jgi:hypothetical protein